MKIYTPSHPPESAKVGWILLWVFGVPMPLLIALLVLRDFAAPPAKRTAAR